MINNSTKI